MAEMRASPVVNPKFKRIAEVLRDLQGPMGEVIPFTNANPFRALMPAASTFENLAYGNSPFSEYAGVTNRRLPIVKTGREGELTDIADVALMASGLPMASRGVARGANYLGDVLTQAVTRNPQATSMRALDEIARMSPVPQIAPKPPQVPSAPPKSDIGFYSQLEAATIPLQNKGTGDQYLAQIQKSAGVKPEEIQWTGLNEFLTGKPSVTKQEIQDYLQANRVDIQEVRLDRTPAMVGAERNAAYDAYDRGEITLEQRNAILERSDPTTTRHHLGAYQGIKTEIPGGENYREILLTLPNQWEKPRALQEANSKRIRELKEQMWGTSGSDEIRSEISRLHRENTLLQQQISDAPIYKSTHFDQPNILAHMRVNDRVVDGKKTLFVEEVQSDWHQAGRKKGYQSKDIESQLKVLEKSTEKRYREIRQLSNEMAALDDTQLDQFNALAAERQRLLNLQDEETDLGNRLYDSRREGVPDAPFKTSWHELTLKRAIQEASEKGYDQIAFTTGKTQAERYDLSKQVDYIDYRTSGSGPNKQYELGVVGKNGDSVDLPKQFFTADELPDVVGKEVADKIISGQGQGGGGRMTLRGVDLQIGGEGMKGFYDNILPKSLEKLGKKFDAKVGKTEMDGVEVWQMDITPKMRESVTTKGQPLFAIPTIGAAALGASMYDQDPLEQFLNSQ